MDIPEEDKMAVAKRRAIQALMRNKSLTPQERSAQMQQIMRGDFAMEDDESSSSSSSSSSSGSEEDSSRRGSFSGSQSSYSNSSGSKSYDTTSNANGTQRSGKDDDESSYSERSSGSSSVCSQYSGSQYTEEKEDQEDDSRTNYNNNQRGTMDSSAHSRGSRGSLARSANSSSSSSAAAAAQQAAAAKQKQKDRQSAILAITRNKNLSVKERQAKMKEIMETKIHRASIDSNNYDKSNSNNSNNEKQQQRRRQGTTSSSKPQSQKNLQDSVREPTPDDDYDSAKPIHMSRGRILNKKNASLLSDLVRRTQSNDPTLTEIVLHKLNLSDDDVIPLLEALGGGGTSSTTNNNCNTHVTTLNLGRNRIGLEGCSTLASSILENDTLTNIDLSGNNLGDEGMEDLSKVLLYNKSLVQLNVEDNKIGNAGATSLAEALLTNTSLEIINLGGNLIGDDGARDLFKVLSTTNDTVKELLLRFNAISDKGATELASALLDNESLRVVDLGHNKITNKGAHDLVKVVGINDTLEELELGGNVGIDESVLEEVQCVLEEDNMDESGSESEGGEGSGSYMSGSSSSSRGSVSSGDVPLRASNKGGVESDIESDEESVISAYHGSDERSSVGSSSQGPPNGELTGGEAMLQDMPDEDNSALAKRQAIQAVMQDKSLGGLERNKKIQDIMAGRVALPKVKAKQAVKTQQQPPKTKNDRGSSRRKVDDASPSSASGSSYDEEDDSLSGSSEDEQSQSGSDNGELTGGEAMLQDMPDEDNSALAKRQAIQAVMQDKSLGGLERNKKIQDIMAGRVALPKVKAKQAVKTQQQPPKTKNDRGSSRRKVDDASPSSASGSSYDEEDDSLSGSSEDEQSQSGGDNGELTGGEAMLQDMPDEDNSALAKRQAIQSVMQDRSLTGIERNKKIQDIMAGRVKLPKVEAKKKEVKDVNGSRRRRIKPKKSASDSSDSESSREFSRPDRQPTTFESSGDESSYSRSESEYSQSETEEDEPTRPAASASGDGAAPTGGEAMLEDMPDEDNAALAKRKAIQSAMQDKSLTGIERNKKIQDIMAGRVELPKVEPKKPPLTKSPAGKGARKANKSAARSSARRGRPVESESSGSDGAAETNSDSGSSSHPERGGSASSSIENNDSNVNSPTGGEAMLEDMPDEDDTQLAKRRAVQEAMKDKSLTPAERNKKLQDIMAGRVKLPPPPKKAPPKKAKAPPSKPKPAPSKAEETTETKPVPFKRRGQHPQKPDAPTRETSNTKLSNKNRLSSPDPMTKPKQPTSQIRRTKSAPTNERQTSSMGSTRATIAHQWKQRMMAEHPRSHDNLLDTLLAHQYRLFLKSPPCQSYFRVVAVVFFSRVVNGVLQQDRYHVVGTNDEPHSIAGSICAERAALMQLRFIPDLEFITKVVIVTDDVDAISPGMLCREFMASHNRIPWDVPIVLGRSVCRKCGFTVSGKACGDADGNFNETDDVNDNMFATCAKGHEEAKLKKFPTPHDFVGSVTTLRDLFPFPSLYARLSSKEALKYGEEYMSNVSPGTLSKSKSNEAKTRAVIANGNKRFNDSAGSMGSYRQEKFDLSMLTEIIEEGDEENADKSTQGSTTSDGKEQAQTEHRDSFASTSSRTPGHRSSMTHSLKTTIDFMRQVREDRQELDSSGMSGLSDLPGTLEHLTARTLRISNRLKPSQRREKLMRLAMEVTAMESHQKLAHPIRYGAAVLFSDSTVAIASQKVALEYGCTLDAVGQLASVIDRKAIHIEEDSPACRPVLLVQCDQFGIAHAPFAPGRAFLTERGYGDCKVLLHQKRPFKSVIEQSNGSDGKADADNSTDLRLIEVEANDLAPAPPDIFGTMMTKNHSQQGGLQIQF